MAAEQAIVSRSHIDEQRFNIRVARAPAVTSNSLPQVLQFCSENAITLLIARCDVSDIHTAQLLEQSDFLLMDTLVYYARNLLKTPLPQDSGNVSIRPLQLGEEAEVKRVAAESFQGYFGHYHADSRLDSVKADEGYAEWAVRSCVDRTVADEVLLATVDDHIVGFATLRVNSSEEGEGVLFGVHPSAQGRGIYRSFMIRAMEWFATKGMQRMVVSTQLNNIAVQKVWTRVGFEPSHGYYTFHKWFDKARV